MRLFSYLTVTSFSFLFAANAAHAAAKLALVSTNRESYEALDVATEAIDSGASVLVFPEWGFHPQDNTSEALLEKWRQLADTRDVYIVLGVRFQGRNTAMVFKPTGGRQWAFRRDGYNSPVPTEEEFKKPLVFDTEFGKAGILIYDESRSKKYLDEIQAHNIQFLLVPNYLGMRITEEELKSRYDRNPSPYDTYHVDILAQLGNQSHVYRSKTGSFEINAFGTARPIGSSSENKTDARGNLYSISYHDLN
jgi:hypothetical protein